MKATPLPVQQKQHFPAWMWLAYCGFLFIQPLIVPDLHIWVVTLAALSAFLAIFFAFVRASGHLSRRLWLSGATLVLGLATFPTNQGASTFFVYAASFVAFSLPSARKVVWIMLAECVIILVEGRLFDHFTSPRAMYHIGWANTLIAIFLVAAIGGGNIFAAEQARSDSKLRLAHQEIEQLAALAERERIARDLHDVLGHTLSVIVLKSELAGRLLESDAPRAAREIADVERTARTALADVREAIGGYRAKGLPAELELARDTLAAAGVALSCESPIPRLSAAEETVLSLAVREAVTNIVRHAHASHCRMTFATTPEGFHSLVVEDDGAGLRHTPLPAEGNGLRGMRERVHSLGGRLSITSGQAAPRPGTTLSIELPAARPATSACVTA